MIIFLIGYMGCGKSTIGRSLARRLGVAFCDMDRRIEEQAGMSVQEIFATRGEEAFRAMERDFLEKGLSGVTDMVVATGGGVPCREGNMELMEAKGNVVYLKMSPSRLVGRLTARGREKRPLIRDMNDEQLLAFIETSLGQREKYYSRAHLVIDCDGVSDDYIARHIESYMELLKLKS